MSYRESKIMIHEASGPSLLSYLAPGRAGFRLGLSLVPGAGAGEEPPGLPFVPAGDAGPFARVFEAWIMSDAGSPVRRVFLVLPLEVSPGTGPDGRHVTNLNLEQGWQRAFLENRSSIISLGEQDDGSGGIRPCRPRFYCRKQDVFFHPPCPACGSGLELCRDDRLLEGHSLSPYSSSSSRYLFCPVCHGRKAAFYAFSAGPGEPARVRDRHALVRDFAALVSRPGAAEGFPCQGCAEADACYGAGGLAGKRLAPLSFYPFHLLVYGVYPLAVSGSGDRLKGSLFRMEPVYATDEPAAVEPPAEATGLRASVQETPAGPGPDDGAVRSILDDVVAYFRAGQGDRSLPAGQAAGDRDAVPEAEHAPEQAAGDRQEDLSGTVMPAGSAPGEHEEDRLETVVLTREQVSTLTKARPAGAMQGEPGPVKAPADDYEAQTVIMGPGRGAEPGKAAVHEDAPESVILAPGKRTEPGAGPGLIPSHPHRPSPAKSLEQKSDEAAQETVIMGSGGAAGDPCETVVMGTQAVSPPGTAAPGPGRPGSGQGDEVPETVIMKPGEITRQAPAQAPGGVKKKQEDDESIEATIIYRKPDK